MILAVLGVLVLVLVGVILHLPYAPPKVEIGPETTVLDGPLREDGMVDYARAFENEAGKGVTADNNAAIPLLQVFGPMVIEDPAVRAATLRKLGLSSLPEEGDYFISLVAWAVEEWLKSETPTAEPDHDGLEEQLRKAVIAPWAPDQYPQLSQWLADNDKAIDRMAAATQRPRYHLPLLGEPPEDLVAVCTRSLLHLHLTDSRALACRAVARARAGRTDDAWQDILAIHRLARLAAQDPLLASQLSGACDEALAAKTGAGLATSGKLSGEQALAMRADLEALPPLPPVADATNTTQRFIFLEAMVKVSQGYRVDRSGDISPQPGRRRSLDPNEMLRVANHWFDGTVEALRQPTHAERKRAQEAWVNRRTQAKADVTGFAGILRRIALAAGGIASRRARSTMTATRLVTTHMLFWGVAGEVQEEAVQRADLTRISLALAAAKADTGAWPQALEELAPKYIKQVPLDRFTGEPLVYKPQADGFVLYSLGINMTDDGGLYMRNGFGGADDVAVWAGITPPDKTK